MDDAALDLAKVHLRRDQLVTLYNARVARWQIVQGAVLAGIGLVVIGYLSGEFIGAFLLTSTGFGGVFMLLSTFALKSYDRAFSSRMAMFRIEVERLKRRTLP